MLRRNRKISRDIITQQFCIAGLFLWALFCQYLIASEKAVTDYSLCPEQLLWFSGNVHENVAFGKVDLDEWRAVFKKGNNSDSWNEFENDILELLVVAEEEVLLVKSRLAVKYKLSLELIDLIDISLAHFFEEIEISRLSRDVFFSQLQTNFLAYRLGSDPSLSSQYFYLVLNITKKSVPELAQDLQIPEAQVYHKIIDLGLSIERDFESPLRRTQRLRMKEMGYSDLKKLESLQLDQAATWCLTNKRLSLEETAELLGVGAQALDFYRHYVHETTRGVTWARMVPGEKITEEAYLEREVKIENTRVQSIANRLNELFQRKPGDSEYRTAASVMAKARLLGMIGGNHPRTSLPNVLGPDGETYLKENGQIHQINAIAFLKTNYFMSRRWLAAKIGVTERALTLFAKRHSIPLFDLQVSRKHRIPHGGRTRSEPPKGLTEGGSQVEDILSARAKNNRTRRERAGTPIKTVAHNLMDYYFNHEGCLPQNVSGKDHADERSLRYQLDALAFHPVFTKEVKGYLKYSDEQREEFLFAVSEHFQSQETKTANEVLRFFFSHEKQLPTNAAGQSGTLERKLRSRLDKLVFRPEFVRAIHAHPDYHTSQKRELLREIDLLYANLQSKAAEDLLVYYFSTTPHRFPVASGQSAASEEKKLRKRLNKSVFHPEFNQTIRNHAEYSREQKEEVFRAISLVFVSDETENAELMLDFYFSHERALPVRSKDPTRVSERNLRQKLDVLAFKPTFIEAVNKHPRYTDAQKRELLEAIELAYLSPDVRTAHELLEFYFKEDRQLLPTNAKGPDNETEKNLRQRMDRYAFRPSFTSAIAEHPDYQDSQKNHLLRRIELRYASVEAKTADELLHFFYQVDEEHRLPLLSDGIEKAAEKNLRQKLDRYAFRPEFIRAVNEHPDFTQPQKALLLRTIELMLQ